MDRTGIRTVTADEVEHYCDRGWAKLDQLLSPELTGRPLDRAKQFVGPDGVDHSPIDRSSWVRFWIALDDVTADMGPVRFVDRSHLNGLIGTTHFRAADPDAALFEDFPELGRRGLSEAVEFRGDPFGGSLYPRVCDAVAAGG